MYDIENNTQSEIIDKPSKQIRSAKRKPGEDLPFKKLKSGPMVERVDRNKNKNDLGRTALLF